MNGDGTRADNHPILSTWVMPYVFNSVLYYMIPPTSFHSWSPSPVFNLFLIPPFWLTTSIQLWPLLSSHQLSNLLFTMAYYSLPQIIAASDLTFISSKPLSTVFDLHPPPPASTHAQDFQSYSDGLKNEGCELGEDMLEGLCTEAIKVELKNKKGAIIPNRM